MPFADDRLAARMLGNPWFAALPADIRDELLAAGKPKRLNGGEFVFRQGDAGGTFYGLVAGTLKVSTLRADGKEAILGLLEPGNWFGEASALDGLPRIHDITAQGNAELLCIEPAAFAALMRHGRFAHAIAVLQAAHTRLAFKLLEDAMLRSTRARIVRRLEQLAHGDATMAGSGRAVVQVTQDALAMMLGITRQTLALELKTLVAAGAIALGYGQVHILSLPLLRALEDDA